MYVIGLTGGTGSGKSTAGDCMRRLGAEVIDCDAVYHELLQTDAALLRQIADAFPQAFAAGGFDRKRLGAIVFADPAALARLEAITRPAIAARVRQLLRDCRKDVAVLEAIGLFEAGFDRFCDTTVAVCAPRQTRLTRLAARDGITEQYAALRIGAQRSDGEYRQCCRHILVNDCDRQTFLFRCERLYQQIIGKGTQNNE